MAKYLRRLDFKICSIKDIEEALKNTREFLLKEITDSNSIYNEDSKFQLKRLIDRMDKKNILDMTISGIESYIRDLITIMDFITGEF